MKKDQETNNSRFLSLVLRHQPGAAGIELDHHGWASVDELLEGCRRKGRDLTLEDLERIVRENNKQRFTFSPDMKKIRANQGHSISVDVQLKEAEPPEYLYHGTARGFLDSIRRTGLKKQERNHVHLSADEATAMAVGKRHGAPVVLKVRAGEMYRNGYAFFLSENKVWLTDHVPLEYIEKGNRELRN